METRVLAQTPHTKHSTRTAASLYEELPSALRLLESRRRDTALALQLQPILDKMPNELASAFDVPRAVMFRQIATPMNEVLLFLKKANELQMRPLILEYFDDLFVGAGNRYKRGLGKLPIYQYTGSDGRDMLKYETIVDFNTSAGRKLKDIRSFDGRTLIEVHHDLFYKITGIPSSQIAIDATHWFSALGSEASCYYECLLTLFVRNGILFENFVTSDSEDEFAQAVVLPSFIEVEKRYGLHPLIVRIADPTEEARIFWDSYPKEVSNYLKTS